jgi:ribosomal protein L12E/L44/L45/RPP1/RPP2
MKIFKYYINIILATKHAIPCCLYSCYSFRKRTKYIVYNSGEECLTAILSSTGKPVDAAQVKAVIEKLKGKQVHEVKYLIIKLITKGQGKLGAGGSAPAPAAKAAKEDKKKD